MDRFAVKYDLELDLESKNSLKLINDRLKDNSTVLEFGPANGRLTRYMHFNRKCTVDIVEYNKISGAEAARYARKALIGEIDGDIENYNWAEEFKEEKYDFIIFADVLEHVYNPLEVLKKCKKLLKKDGVILLSVPNIANDNIILSLLQDEFSYTSTGLLDDTHIRFFTYKSLYAMVNKLGYRVSYADYTLGGLGSTEVKVNIEDCSNELLSVFDQHLFGSIYQLVFEIKADGKENVGFKETPIMYMPSAYYEKNDIYSEDSHLECESIKCIDFKYEARFNIANLNLNNKFRFDPVEGRFCCVELLKVSTDIEDLVVFNTNAIRQDGGIFYFIAMDPIIEFYGEKLEKATYVTLQYRITNINILHELTVLEEKINALK